MPPRNRKNADESEPTTVRDIADARVDLDLDAEVSDERSPFTFRLGEQDWSVPAPDVAQTLDAEQAVYLSDFFELMMGEDLWEEFSPVFRAQKDPTLTWKLARGMSRHFGMDPASVEKAVTAQDGNRAQRRGMQRGRPRRA